ncbi:DUF2784 family protein [Legionella londiniensis]|uniref:DUF2784 family protein n=1 Tax=Legionella londiniensis TaxID=45068 RepID=UPI003B4FFC25
MFFGFGYCLCTEWHWEVKRKLGTEEISCSYIKYYVDHLTGMNWNPLLVTAVTGILGISAFLISCWLNLQDWKAEVR